MRSRLQQSLTSLFSLLVQTIFLSQFLLTETAEEIAEEQCQAIKENHVTGFACLLQSSKHILFRGGLKGLPILGTPCLVPLHPELHFLIIDLSRSYIGYLAVFA